ncbi:hypothetical protein DSM112329_00159 [Paraconexibacter sp. AEG42_29]|uniref:Uncharacterized protein n=1 Tax=Paraconexibacter sp. AEG42_29 TaxID=2997339 RepID=A0AAU7ANU2_9ACTN
MGLLDDAIREHLELKRRHGADASEVARQEHEALGPVVRGELTIPDSPPAATSFHDDPAQGGGGPLTLDKEPEDRYDPVVDEPSFFTDTAPPAPAGTPERVRAQAEPLPPVKAPAADPAPVADTSQNTVAFSLDDLEAAAEGAPTPAPDPVPPAAAPDPVPPVTASQPPAPATTPASPPAQPPAAASSPAPAAAAPPAAATPPPAAPTEKPVQELSWDAPEPAPDVAPRDVAADVVPADPEPQEHDELEETPEFLQETPEHDRLWFEQRPPRDFDF